MYLNHIIIILFIIDENASLAHLPAWFSLVLDARSINIPKENYQVGDFDFDKNKTFFLSKLTIMEVNIKRHG